MKSKFAQTLFVALTVTSLSALACGQVEKLGTADRSWVQSDVMLYGFMGKGQFFKTKFGSNKVDVITAHQFDDAPEVIVSPDRRYVAYWGGLGDGQSPTYLYDLKLNTERTIPQPDGHNARPAFSPNSDMLLLDVTNAKLMKLYLFDIASAQVMEVPYPEDAGDDPSPYFTGFWSLDGKSIYVAAKVGKKDPDFYRYDVTSGKYTAIAGHFINDSRIAIFIENGQEIKTLDLFGPCEVQSMCGDWSIKSPDGTMVASVNYAKDHGLWVTGKDAKPILVDKGGYDVCEGDWVHLHGWLDNRYLIYGLHEVPYIYDLKSGKKSILFDRRTVEYYFW